MLHCLIPDVEKTSNKYWMTTWDLHGYSKFTPNPISFREIFPVWMEWGLPFSLTTIRYVNPPRNTLVIWKVRTKLLYLLVQFGTQHVCSVSDLPQATELCSLRSRTIWTFLIQSLVLMCASVLSRLANNKHHQATFASSHTFLLY